MAMNIDSMQFHVPVPGMSLATEPKSRAWERPAQYTTPEETLEFYMERITAPEQVAQILEVLENGYPVTSMVDSLVLGGVMEGVHSLDNAVIIAPALFELITGLADSVDIEYEKGFTNKNKREDASLVTKAMRMPKAMALVETIEEEDIQRIETAASLMSRPVADESDESAEEEQE
tara:strand:- start:4963 stop:5490 length:528 start_codon:yes stop_codon:yes gene_type:complete